VSRHFVNGTIVYSKSHFSGNIIVKGRHSWLYWMFTTQ